MKISYLEIGAAGSINPVYCFDYGSHDQEYYSVLNGQLQSAQFSQAFVNTKPIKSVEENISKEEAHLLIKLYNSSKLKKGLETLSQFIR